RGEGYGLLATGAYTYLADWNSSPLTGLKSTIYTGGPQASLYLNLVTANNPNSSGADHHHRITVAGTVLTDTSSLDGHDLYKYTYTTSGAAMFSSANPFSVQFLTDYSTNTRNGIMYYKLRLPQAFN